LQVSAGPAVGHGDLGREGDSSKTSELMKAIGGNDVRWVKAVIAAGANDTICGAFLL
jgi:hypothetical protein